MLRICFYICLVLYFMCKDIANAGICNEDNNLSAVTKIRLQAYKGGTFTNNTSLHIFGHHWWVAHDKLQFLVLSKGNNRVVLHLTNKVTKQRYYQCNSSRFAYIESTLANPGNIKTAILPDRNTILYIHGFMENTEADNVQIIIRAYLDKGDVNVILVDWGDVAIDINYFYVASQVAAVGKALAKSLEKLVELIDLNTLHVIGHSLGAHVAGHIGRYMNVTLSRITGLDPALPLFYPSACHIKSSDAEAVVILHTDGGFYGTPIDTGSVDFYANRGISPQPGCPIIIGGELCSHQRSVKIYAESLKNPVAFLAHRCFDKITESGKDDKEVHFGDSTPRNIFGPYCFNTNANSPYGKGT